MTVMTTKQIFQGMYITRPKHDSLNRNLPALLFLEKNMLTFQPKVLGNWNLTFLACYNFFNLCDCKLRSLYFWFL